MISYNDLYEVLRKEKNSLNLQLLPKNFLTEFAEYLNDKKAQAVKEDNLFDDYVVKSKKQLENSIIIFKELILNRKRKLLNLVFTAVETGLMKRDFENMLAFEKEIFEKLVKAFEEGDRELSKIMSGVAMKVEDKNKMILFTQNVDEFVDMSGNVIGPFSTGTLANLESEVSSILVSSGKASFVDEN